MELIGYVAAVFIGLILGLLGGGGSILSIPILVYLFHIDIVVASAYSLFIVGMTSLAGAIPKYKEHLVNIRTGILFGIPSIAGIFATRKWVIPSIPEVVLHSNTFTLHKRELILGVFAILMILASFSMIRDRKEKEADHQKFRTFLVIIEGTLIGLLLIIPALVLLTGLPFKTAVGTSLFIIAINSLLGFLGDVMNYAMNWPFLLSITALAIMGILIGNRFSKTLDQTKLRKSFGWFVLLMGAWILAKEFLSI
jgi:uncharacterized membrane protein YfcA